MTSNYTKNRGLSQQTLTLWKTHGENPRDITSRLRFYLSYLPEVAPDGLTVHHLPRLPSTNLSQEIQFWLGSGKIFMTGLVSMETNTSNVLQPAADQAYTVWKDGDFEKAEGTWRFFTGGDQVRLYICRGKKDECELLGLFHPIENAWDLAAHLQREYDGMKKAVASRVSSHLDTETVDGGDTGTTYI